MKCSYKKTKNKCCVNIAERMQNLLLVSHKNDAIKAEFFP